VTRTDRIRFSLFENALDYLQGAADLADKDEGRSWKYALLHLVAGIELLLKARLQAEHWSLLFANVDVASEKALAEGDFASVDFRAALDRVTNITGVQLRKENRERLELLRRYRNRVQHFAIDLGRDQVLPLLGYGYHFSIEFVQQHLSEQVEGETAELLQGMTQKLTSFYEFVSERLRELAPRLEGAYMLVGCSRCWQDTLELGGGDPRCLFCGFTDTPDVAASEADLVAGPESCPECGGPCVLLYTESEDPPGWVCFQCGVCGDYSTCEYCGALFAGEPMPGERCPDCWKALLEKD